VTDGGLTVVTCTVPILSGSGERKLQGSKWYHPDKILKSSFSSSLDAIESKSNWEESAKLGDRSP